MTSADPLRSDNESLDCTYFPYYSQLGNNQLLKVNTFYAYSSQLGNRQLAGQKWPKG